MKYKHIFKKWYFWVFIIIHMIISYFSLGHITHIVEYIGLFIGSFIVAIIFFTFIWILSLIKDKIKNKNKISEEIFNPNQNS